MQEHSSTQGERECVPAVHEHFCPSNLALPDINIIYHMLRIDIKQFEFSCLGRMRCRMAPALLLHWTCRQGRCSSSAVERLCRAFVHRQCVPGIVQPMPGTSSLQKSQLYKMGLLR